MGVICLDEEVVAALQKIGAPPGYLIPNHKNVSEAVIKAGMQANKVSASCQTVLNVCWQPSLYRFCLFLNEVS